VEQVDEKEPVEKVKVKYQEYDIINKVRPIWTRDPADVSKNEYVNFYKAISNDWDEYLTYKHFKVEGNVNFRAILYIPKKAPHDMFQKKEKSNDIKLYVKKVFITDNCKEIMPEYLYFVKGIVDCDDIPLNVSREMLQENKHIAAINKQLVKKSLELFSELAKTDEDWKVFYENFSKNLKLGMSIVA
jgi:molecular chaperone HtpG